MVEVSSGSCADVNDDGLLLEGTKVRSWGDEVKEAVSTSLWLSSLSASLTVMKGSDDKVALDRLTKS